MVFIACLATCLSSNIAFRFSDTQTHFDRKYLHSTLATLQEFQREEMYCVNKTEKVSQRVRESGCFALQWFEDKVGH